MSKKPDVATQLRTALDEVERITRRVQRLMLRLERIPPKPDESRVTANFRDSLEFKVALLEGASESLIRVTTTKTLEQFAEERIERAQRVCRAAYYRDVRSIAKEFVEMWRSGEFESNEAADEWLTQTVDANDRLIYTENARKIVFYSNNGNAYVEDFGPNGLVVDGDIAWSKMAFAAMRRDLDEAIFEMDVDVNGNPPQKVTSHPFIGASDSSGVDVDEPCQYIPEHEQDPCEQPRRLHTDNGKTARHQRNDA